MDNMPNPSSPNACDASFYSGFNAGAQAARYPLRTNAAERRMFAIATAGAGTISALGLLATMTNSKYRGVFGVFAIGGIIIGTVVATARVLGGGPTPWEGM
jgi:hypothetical protein